MLTRERALWLSVARGIATAVSFSTTSDQKEEVDGDGAARWNAATQNDEEESVESAAGKTKRCSAAGKSLCQSKSQVSLLLFALLLLVLFVLASSSWDFSGLRIKASVKAVSGKTERRIVIR